MYDALKSLQKYFPLSSGSAEMEKGIRSDAFVDTSFVKRVTSKIAEPFIIIKSPKGVGKSYICDELSFTYNSHDKISIKISPTDIDTSMIAQCSHLSSKISCAMYLMLRAIASKIGSTFLDDDIPLNRSEYNLYNTALQDGQYRKSYFDILAKLLLNSIPFYEKISSSLKDNATIDGTHAKLASDISSVLDNQNKIFYLFIDDIDLVIENNGTSLYYEDCWAIIAAAFDLASKFSCIHCIVSVRNDVWHTMKSKKIGSDRRDKITTVIDLTCSDEDIDRIIRRRFLLALKDIGSEGSNPLDIFFAEDKISLLGRAGIKRDWFSWFVKQSRNRPRDSVQLISSIISRTIDCKIKKINSDSACGELVNFAKSRLENAAFEYSNICDSIDFIVKNIKHTRFTHTEAMEFFSKVPSMRSIMYEGKALQNKQEDAIKILRVLHMANIINVRYKDDNAPDGYAHMLYTDDEDVVSPKNIGMLSKYEFEVHPVFHSLINENKKGF